MKKITVTDMFQSLIEKHKIYTVANKDMTTQGYIIDAKFMKEFALIVATHALELAANEAKCIIEMEPDYLDVGSETFTSIVDKSSILNVISQISF